MTIPTYPMPQGDAVEKGLTPEGPAPSRATGLRALLLAGALSQCALAVPALAQDQAVDEPETIVESIEPQGLQLGAFKVYPRLTVDLRYDSNIYNRPVAADDKVAVLRPGLRLASDLGRHAVQLDLSAEARRHADFAGEDSEQWAVRAQGRLDLANRFTVTGHAGMADRIERRGSLGDEFLTDRPVSFRELVAGVGVARLGGILEWQASVDTRRSAFDNATSGGLPIDLSFRDVRRDSLTYQVNFRRAGRLGLTGRFSASRLVYDDLKQRNSSGFSVLAGVIYEATDLIDLEAAVGYVQHTPGSSATGKIRAFDYSLRAGWTPRPRIRLELNGSRSVERSPILQADTVLQSAIDARGSFAFDNRTLLGLQAGLVRDEFRGIDRRDTRYFAEGTVRRVVSPRLAAIVGIGARRQSASGLGSRDYDGMTARAGISLVL